MIFPFSNFKFTPRDLRGIAVLLITSGVLVAIVFYLSNRRGEPANYPANKSVVNTLAVVNPAYRKSEKRTQKQPTLFQFDPNTLSSEQWQQFGLTEKQVATIDRYRQAGGKFKVKGDVSKLYVISDELYAKLEPYINIDIATQDELILEKTTYIKFYDTLNVDLNRADSAKLTQLKGIGAAFAKRIIKYRNKLGGFISKSQLLEVYGMDTTKYNGFKNNVTVDINNIKKININTAEFKQLTSHPYFEYHIVKSIFNYRNKVGKINSIEELRKIDLMKDNIYHKITPYITVE